MPDSTDPTVRFTSRVSDYVKYRPGYPSGVLELLTHRLELGKGKTVADVGSGTGIFSKFLLESGANVIAIEPNAAMRAAAEESLAGEKNVRSLAAAAEATTLGEESVDLVTAAQAFHWFDQPAFRKECVRILKPGGYLALIWNDRKLTGTMFLEGYEQLLMDYGVEYAAVRHNNVGDAELAKFFEPVEMDKAEFPSEQTFDYASLLGRLESSSYSPPRGHAHYEPIVAGLKKLFDATAEHGRVTMTYDTLVYFGQLKPAASTLFGR